MLYYGSEGDTAKELKKTLGYEDAGVTDELLHETFSAFLKNLLRAGRFPNGTVIQSTNAIVANKSIDLTPEFRRKIKEWYEASVREVDFTKNADAIVRGVNDWIKNQTHGKMNTLITELNPTTLMILLNAMYFKGAWKTPFEKNKTSPQFFFNNGRESEKKNSPFTNDSYSENDDLKAAQLPFKGDGVVMLIVLPNKRCQLKSTEKSVTPKNLLTNDQGLQEKTVDIFPPKFKFEKDFTSVLKQFGTKKTSDRDVDDFSESSFRNNTDVGRLVNKVDSIIEGKTSEVSGTTEIIDGNEVPQEITVNHPFLFLIVEKGSGSDWIIFLGSINNL
ncbi:uncharacterized serpin-like protein TK1782 [Nephila pilipes]|uniref:Uncharacterized serpin-like protein TK1782 n=1 Tax=Nephila pilipes TaxID=299642 RepID=A0A8X6TR84_NEPPI|nr:uncharacterized serpin-like protein TK1782 [Nephila pilipes]